MNGALGVSRPSADASGVVAAYVLALVLRPKLCPPLVVRLPLITLSLGSLMAFGGRTALMTVLAILSCLALVEAFKLLRGKRTSLPMAIHGVVPAVRARRRHLRCSRSRHLRQDVAALLVG